MSDSDSIHALGSREYIADDVYRVNPMDRDSGRNADPGFDKECNKEGDEGKEREGHEETGNRNTAGVPTPADSVRSDGVVLSDSALEMLGADPPGRRMDTDVQGQPCHDSVDGDGRQTDDLTDHGGGKGINVVA